MVQTFLFIPLIWKDADLQRRVSDQLDSGDAGVIDIDRYRLEFQPEKGTVLCGVAPGGDPWKIIPAEITYDGLRALLRKEEPVGEYFRYL